MTGASGLSFRHARLECRHQIDDRPNFLFGRCRKNDLVARRLAIDQFEHGFSVGIGELLGLKVRFQIADQLPGHIDLAFGHLDVIEPVEQFDRRWCNNLIGIHHGREQEPTIGWTQGCDVLLGTHHKPRNPNLARFLHCRHQQLVGLLRLWAWGEVVGRVVKDRVDVGQVDELFKIDRFGRSRVERIEFIGRDDHIFAGGQLITLYEVLVLDLFTGLFAHALLPNP